MIILRKIEREDNSQVERLVKTVMTELKCAGEGFSLHDIELTEMFQSYNVRGHLFLVYADEMKILGCGGIGALPGESNICELKKMYFYPELRGKGKAVELMRSLLEFAKDNYTGVYIETMDHMRQARSLYEGFGFKQIDGPMGDTGHFGCNTFYFLNFK